MVGARGESRVARACWEKRRPEVFSRHFVTQGGYEGAEPEVSLTAFVLIALLESREVCKDYVNVSGPALNPTMVWGVGHNWHLSHRTMLRDEVPNPYSSHLRIQTSCPLCPELGHKHHQSLRIPCPEVPVSGPALHGGPDLVRLGPVRDPQNGETSHEAFQR